MPVAILRSVSPRMADCELTHLDRQPISIALAEKQHEEYEDALRRLGCEIIHAPGLPFHPDSVFVEDCAFVVDELAIITRPGAESRRGEAVSLADTLEPHRTMYFIEAPATLDGGDILRVGRQVWVGLSSRSNAAAVEQMRHFLKPYGYAVEGVHLKSALPHPKSEIPNPKSTSGCLHLKSAVTQVGANTLLLNPDWVDATLFPGFEIIETDPDEPGAANALLVGDSVIYSADFPMTALWLAEAGVELFLVDNSEVLKAEGGVSCCSVVF